MEGLKMIVDLTEFEIRQAASDFSSILKALSLSASSRIVNTGESVISLIINLLSTFSSFPEALLSNFSKLNFEFSAIARNVVMRQLLTAATSKCSGDHIPSIPLGNSGGVATSIFEFKLE